MLDCEQVMRRLWDYLDGEMTPESMSAMRIHLALGATVLGMEGVEIATLFQVAMMRKLPHTALRDAVFSHPTLAESLNNMFMAMDRAG